MTRKEIWLPVTTTKVTVTAEGTVSVWDEIEMSLQPIKKDTGFAKDEKK